MIELGTRSERWFTYDEAVLYGFCLGDGWRLPTLDDLNNIHRNEDGQLLCCWFQDQQLTMSSQVRRMVLPAREVKDA